MQGIHLRHFKNIWLKDCYKSTQFTKREILKQLAEQIDFHLPKTVKEWSFICEIHYKQEFYSDGFL